MKKRVTSIILIAVLVMTTLAGCGEKKELTLEQQVKKMSKADLQKNYLAIYDQYESVCAENDDLRTMLSGIQNEEVPSAAIGITGDGTGRFTFNSTDSKIIFPTTYQYPNAEQIAPNGEISIVKDVAVGVNSTWIYKLTGANLELEHSSGISGTIKVSKIGSNYPVDILQSDVMEPWFEGLPPSELQYTKIFVNNQAYGVQAKTPTLIDSEDAFITTGMLGFGTYSVTYIFVYRGLQDSSKDESINNVVNSIRINNNSLLVGDM